jgi:hypothetical protein
VDLAEICSHLSKRRRMYLPDERYSSAVAFMEGFNIALGGEPLKGFQEWVSTRIRGGRSSLHWSIIVASVRVPEVLEGGMRLDQVPNDLDGLLTDDLLRMLGDFIGSSNLAAETAGSAGQGHGKVLN